MEKTIIVVYGRANEGKTSTLLELYKMLTYSKVSDIDIAERFTYKGIEIGIVSKSDPTQESLDMFNKKLNEFTKDCNIIICTSRTKGLSVGIIDKVEKQYECHSLWISTLWSPTLNQKILNNLLSKNLKELIDCMINSQDIYLKKN